MECRDWKAGGGGSEYTVSDQVQTEGWTTPSRILVVKGRKEMTMGRRRRTE